MAKRLSTENSKIIFVSGFAGARGADRAEVQENCWSLHSYVYDVSERKHAQELENLEYIVNKSAEHGVVCQNNVRQLQQKLLDMPLDDPGITRVVFGHSHGAKIVYEALKEEVLSSFLASNGMPNAENRSAKIRQIRAHLAVITLGGIQDIPRSFAEICCNVRFKDDGVAKSGLKIFGEEHEENKDVELVGRTGSNLLDIVSDSASDGFAFSAKAAVKFKEIADGVDSVNSPLDAPLKSAAIVSAGSSGVSAASALSGRHYMKKYLESDRIMKKIIKILGVENENGEGAITDSSVGTEDDDFVVI